LLNINISSKFVQLKGKDRKRYPYKVICNSECENSGNFEGYPPGKDAVKAAVYEDMRGRHLLKNPFNNWREIARS
jgi:hypothetical protein